MECFLEVFDKNRIEALTADREFICKRCDKFYNLIVIVKKDNLLKIYAVLSTFYNKNNITNILVTQLLSAIQFLY
ncbi:MULTISPECIES: hypothetical protein [spotted fever group]|uniref:hypothetical protein n=1 Tax=spotted fever group TaxID=114277 RepID=UPI0001A60763|nr:hypothetical protein [Rickettsia endosymbiont of Ixodes scapularis]EER21103.1 hypothetical protein REIS_0222 [Rickettsia endosymbiont of Ixodes scapularis]